MARSATGARVVSRGGGAAVSQTPKVSARAATTQKVVGTGTKVATKTAVESDDCQNLYNACMDQFCIVDNANGGRCVCADKYKTFDKLLTEIDSVNLSAYKLSTVGAEAIEATVSQRPVLQVDAAGQTRESMVSSALETGDVGGALRKVAHDTCAEKLSQCSDKIDILSAMYSGRVNSDCVAYENALKKSLADAKSNLQKVQGGLREVALDSAKNANKYDLGQCTLEFKKCMQTTAECGNDFTGCVDASGQTSTQNDFVVLTDTVSNLTISKSMYNNLSAKAPICQSVLNQCVRVQDKVFDAFLREAYPQLILAEKLAESNTRQNCIADVSNCFRNACRDNIDANDKNVSYDACLTRPEMMLSFCKVELNKCGIDSTNANVARESDIWDFVLARLAGMKVDACTNDLKDCLADDNRCGADYSKCVGLSTEQIIRMCPYDKLVGCKNVHDDKLKTDEVYENLTQVVQGIILGIDNAMLATCQAAVDSATQRVCGEDLNCGNVVNLDTIGTTSLTYKICEYQLQGNDVVFTDNCYADQSLIPDVDLGRVEFSATGELGPVVPYTVLIDVPIYWESITVGLDGKFEGLDDYVSKLEARQVFMTDEQRDRLDIELNSLKNGLNNAVSAIEADPIVAACMNGRKIDGYDFKKIARFPNITQNVRALLATKMLNRAKNNYYAKYDTYNERQLQDFIKISERQAKIKGENFKDKRREIARQSCVSMAEMSALPKSAEPPSGVGGKVLIGVILALITVAVCVLTFGGGAVAIGAAGSALGSVAGAGVTTGASASLAAAGAAGGQLVWWQVQQVLV